jgi:hypothetical protein
MALTEMPLADVLLIRGRYRLSQRALMSVCGSLGDWICLASVSHRRLRLRRE